MLATRLFIADSLLNPRPCPPISNLDDHFDCLQSFLSQIVHREPPSSEPPKYFCKHILPHVAKQARLNIHCFRTSVRRACWRFRRIYKTFEKIARRNMFHNIPRATPPSFTTTRRLHTPDFYTHPKSLRIDPNI